MNKTTLVAALAFATLGSTACDSPGIAYGDANSIIAVMSPELWDEVADATHDALEPTIRTVRDEKTFTVTYQEPYAEFWPELRRFRQMLLVGTADDPWVVEALDKARDPITEPGLHQVFNVWSRGQSVTLVLLPPGGGAADLAPHLPEVNALLDKQFRQYARVRMYQSGPDSALADSLYLEAGFSILVPEVYRWKLVDSTYVFRNDQPDPSELIREIVVSWHTPIPVDMQPEGILEWRAESVASYYSEPQVQLLDRAHAEPFEFRGDHAYEIQAEWKNAPEANWPAGGPFITRAIICENQNRMYLVDGWLYAPAKEKYEYMIQLQTILDTFRCGAA